MPASVGDLAAGVGAVALPPDWGESAVADGAAGGCRLVVVSRRGFTHG